MYAQRNTCAPEEPQGFSIADLARATNLSRATIRYYEQAGIVASKTEGARRYSGEDVLRVSEAVMLNNLGIPPKESVDVINQGFCSLDRLDFCIDELDRRVVLLQAQRRCLATYVRLLRDERPCFVEDVGVYCVTPQMPIKDKQPMEEALELPLMGHGGVFIGPVFDAPTALEPGIVVALEDLPLVDGFPVEHTRCGGGACLRTTVLALPGATLPRHGWDETFAELRRFASGHRLEASAPAFVPYALPVDEGVCAFVCLPVEKAARRFFGLAGR